MKKLLSILAAFTLVLTGCGASDAFVYTVSSPIETLDPKDASYSQTFTLFSDIYTGATIVNADGEIENGAATDIKVSDDGLTYTISLRDDMKWVDNTGAEMGNVTAHDYEFSYKRMVDPESASVYSYIFELIDNASEIIAGEKDADELAVKALDDYTLEIKLDHVAPYFESMLAFGSFVPQSEEAIDEYGDEYGVEADTTWYNGPYYVTSYDPTYEVVVEKNDAYYDADEVSVEKINYRLNEDSNSRYLAFLNGEVDFAEITTPEDYKAGKEEGVITDEMTAYSYYAVLNNDESSVTSDEDLRMALSYGFDRAKILESVYGDINQPIEYLIPSDITTSAYDGVEYRDYAGDSLTSYDEAKANEYFDKYMDKMGYTDRDQITVEFLTSDSGQGQKLAEVLQSFYLQTFGITINTTVQPFTQYVDSRSSGAFDMYIQGWGPDYADPSTYLGLWQSSQIGVQNYAAYSDADFDKLYEEANAEQDTETRFEEFAELEKMIVESGTVIPFYQKNNPIVVSEGTTIPQHLFLKISHEFLEVE